MIILQYYITAVSKKNGEIKRIFSVKYITSTYQIKKAFQHNI